MPWELWVKILHFALSKDRYFYMLLHQLHTFSCTLVFDVDSYCFKSLIKELYSCADSSKKFWHLLNKNHLICKMDMMLRLDLQLIWIDDFDWFVFWLWNKCLVFKCRHSRIVEEQLTGVHLRSQPQPYVTKVNVYQPPPPPPASNGGGPPGVNRPNMLFRSGYYINSILSASYNQGLLVSVRSLFWVQTQMFYRRHRRSCLATPWVSYFSALSEVMYKTRLRALEGHRVSLRRPWNCTPHSVCQRAVIVTAP